MILYSNLYKKIYRDLYVLNFFDILKMSLRIFFFTPMQEAPVAENWS